MRRRGLINGNVENKLRKVDSVHSKKLLHLGIDIKKKVDKNKVIFNFSNIILTEEQKDVLSYGLDYCIPQTKLAFHKFYLYFEKLCSTIKNCDIYNNNFNNVANNITTIANNTFIKFSHQRKQTRDSDAFLSPLHTLKNDNSIVITKPDKGRGVVIVNKCDYKQKLMDILNDQTKFKRISTEISTHLLYLEDKLNRLLRTIKSSISLNTYNSLLSSGSRPGVLYGLPKVHKPNIPLRPIISSIGTFNYNAAKFLVPVISPLTTNHYTIDNSTAFAKEITSLNYQNPVTMASFDVESLFTNVPLHETTELIVNNLNISHLDKFGLDKVHFRKLLEITAHHSVFCFDDCLYTQTDGVAMGSPLGPSYANAFLCHHEQDWLEQCPLEFKPLHYRRYIDDTFLLFKHPSHVNLFLDYLNSKHPSIKFTCEIQKDNQLPFLDTIVTNNNGNFHTSIYRKPTFTGLGLHFLSFTPYIYKINSVKTLITRAYNVCSNWAAFHIEMSFLKNFFLTNGYPLYIFDKITKTFLCKKFTDHQTVFTVKRDHKYVKLPYMGDLSCEIRKQLKVLLQNNYPQIKFTFVFSNTNTIAKFLKQPFNYSSDLCSNVVYLFTCPSCQARYVGSTSRWLRHRISEHKGKSFRTGLPLSKPSFSAIREHSLQHSHPFSNTDFSILSSHSSRQDLITSESLLIKKMKPELNNITTTTPLFTH
ncbi:uncharacterized protein [Penaeus vannamei]|uniref:uncharacterized protein n=1 Tax=Penaeus vannamei TaxID=6689 RepID=UPI00387FADA4